MAQPVLNIHLPPLHHGGQYEVAHDPARFKVLCCGRRWGKTRLGTLLCLAAALKGGRAWWVAPSYKVAAVGWRGLKALARQIPGVTLNESERLVSLPGGGTVQVRSGDDPDSLRGDSLDFVVLDEAAFCKEAVWEEALRPALADRRGRALIISTPHGKNWFFHLFQKGRDPLQKNWKSWTFDSYSNPFIDDDEIDEAKANLPERIFRQEFLAIFLEGSGDVFRLINEAATALIPAAYIPEHRYVMGIDWGRTGDFTVAIVIDQTDRRMVAMDRFTGIGYELQKKRIVALAQQWRVSAILAEYNSMGGPIVENLQQVPLISLAAEALSQSLLHEGLPIAGFNTTASSKGPLIEDLALAIETKLVQIQNIPVLIGELEAYTYVLTKNGRITYSAPEGAHDDTVIALALAWRLTRNTISGPLMN
jgi:phage terminase large subunit-like protein